ncbi:MAG: TonB-dependent receptor [Rhodothermales bacterium]
MKHMLLQIALLAALDAAAQTSLEGRVVSGDAPVPFASVGVRGTTLGAAANLDGFFVLPSLPAGGYLLVVSAVGYVTEELAVEVRPGQTNRVEIALREATIEAGDIVVTGTLIETYVKDSPVKVDVIAARFLEKIPTANVMDVLQQVNGLYQQIDCAVCGTNNIRINGMDGPYTAVLIDGMPIMSSLATVYGLNGISPALIKQVEVIKGPISTLYGSEAMGGVINIITKSPQTAPRFSINTFATSDAEYAVDLGVVPSLGRIASLLSATFFHNDRFLDDNGDDFADLTLNTRVSLFGKTSFADRRGRQRLDLSSRYYVEDRLGGTRAFIERFSDALRGSDTFYGETIRTRRLELLGSYYFSDAAGAKLSFAYNDHRQDSYYGRDSYQASQSTGFVQGLWPLQLNARHAVLLGSALRLQRYDDNTGSTGRYDAGGELVRNRPDDRFIPGLFAQHEAVWGPAVRTLAGMRLDYQGDAGVIASPRISVMVSPGERSTARLNLGTGFRVVNLFTEDHAAYSGARATILLEDLKPERSVSGTLSLQHILPLGIRPLTIDLEGFYTYFTNKIEPNYETAGLILYRNLAGSATTRGLSLTLSQSMGDLPLSYTAGITWMDVFVRESGGRMPLEFAPSFQGAFNATYRLLGGLAIDYTANLTGPMKLPEYAPPFSRPAWSPTYSVHNLQVTKDLDLPGGSLVQAYVAVENLFGYTQPAPLIDPQNPFGDRFDTAYVYGPIHGRCLGAGVRLMVR